MSTEESRPGNGKSASGPLFRELVENAIAGVYAHSQDGFTYVNQRMTEMTGHDESELVGERGLVDLARSMEENRVKRFIDVCLDRKEEVQFIFEATDTAGETRYFEVHGTAREKEGNLLMIGTMLDVTERKEMEDALMRSRENYRVIFENSPYPMWVFDTETLKFLEVNEAAVDQYGYTKEEFRNMKIDALRPPESRLDVLEMLEEEQQEAFNQRGEVKHQTRNGTIIDVEVTSSTMNYNGRPAGLVLAKDITERKRAQEKIEHMAHYDPLTDLPNRPFFTKKLSRAIEDIEEKDKTLAVMFLDLDGFKQVNDAFGHSVGDRMLKDLSKRFRGSLSEDYVISRWGGDEFTIFLPELDTTNEVRDTAQSIFDVLDQPFRVRDRSFHLSASIGIALYPEDGTDSEELISKADIAMFQAKEESRNTFEFYTEGEKEEKKEVVKLVNEMKASIDDEDFMLFYQPQVAAATGRIKGVEALVRWNHPDGDLKNPTSFIPVAEASGLIIPMGRWILREAVRQHRKWTEEHGWRFPVSVNVSAGQILNTDILETVEEVLSNASLPPEMLELEITEHSVMQDLERGMNVLESFRDMGVRVAVDDFGTGHSSLRYLTRLPFDTLKIDRAFVQDIEKEQYSTELVKLITMIARRLDLRVVAEGVENELQAESLKKFRDIHMQGFLFCHPKAPDEIVDFLQENI